MEKEARLVHMRAAVRDYERLEALRVQVCARHTAGPTSRYGLPRP